MVITLSISLRITNIELPTKPITAEYVSNGNFANKYLTILLDKTIPRTTPEAIGRMTGK